VNFGIVGKIALPPCSDRQMPTSQAIGCRLGGMRETSNLLGIAPQNPHARRQLRMI